MSARSSCGLSNSKNRVMAKHLGLCMIKPVVLVTATGLELTTT